MAIIVSLPKQRVFVYRNGILIGSSSCSTGKEGYETPTGVFTILEKEEEHYSKTAKRPSTSVVERITPPADVQKAIDERMKPGMVFVTTDKQQAPTPAPARTSW